MAPLRFANLEEQLVAVRHQGGGLLLKVIDYEGKILDAFAMVVQKLLLHTRFVKRLERLEPQGTQRQELRPQFPGAVLGRHYPLFPLAFAAQGLIMGDPPVLVSDDESKVP